MKPWREVLAERGWTVRLGCAVVRAPHDESWWWVYVSEISDGTWNAEVWSGDKNWIGSENADDEESAFVALLALPIGPGRVTVGVLLGVATRRRTKPNRRNGPATDGG